MSKPKYDISKVSREALEDCATFELGYYIDGTCGTVMQRIFDEARVPAPPTVAELQVELYEFLLNTAYTTSCVAERLRVIEAARKREAGQ